MENYICINGKKAELTEEQMKALGLKLPKVSPFARAERYDKYYIISSYGGVNMATDYRDNFDDRAFNFANYCTDKSIMVQRELHETLNRLLWRYSMEHKAKGQPPFEICYDYKIKRWECMSVSERYNYFGSPRFDSFEIAKNAIEEIIKPFIAEHPNFVL